MVSTYTPNLLLENPATADQPNVWGVTENTGRTLLDAAVSGILNLDVSGGANVVLTSNQGATDQSRNRRFNFSGTLTGNIDVLWPSGRNRFFSVSNNTTGSFTLSAGVNNGSGSPAGSVVAIQQGQTLLLASDGTNVTVDLSTGAGGSLLSANNLSDVASASTSRANLGLGSSATHPASDFMQSANNLSDVGSASTSRINLGLGSLAVLNSVNNSNWSGTALSVPNGGTGGGSWTAHGILLGEGSGALTATAAMINGQLLVGQTSADPLPKALSGDATLAASGALTISAGAISTAKIAANAADNTKIAQMASNTIKGNNTGGTANALDLTISQVKTMLGFASATSSDFTITSAGTATFTHGLGALPTFITYYLVCQTGELGFSSGDLLHMNPDLSSSGPQGMGMASVATSTTVSIFFGSNANVYQIIRKDTGNIAGITNTNWKLRIIAIAI